MPTPEHDVLQTAAALVRAFGSHDAPTYFTFFAEDASFIFYTHPEMLTSRQEWEELWASWERESGFRVHSCESHEPQVQMVAHDVAIFRHIVVSRIEMDKHLDTVKERETIVFRKTESSWIAVHEHLSPLEETT